MANYWLAKTEPEEFSWENMKDQTETKWDGVRNYQARGYLQAMNLGDKVLIYHSGKKPEIVGIAEVSKEAFADGQEGKWVAVMLKTVAQLPKPVTLAQIKQEAVLSNMVLLKQSRLSVSPVSDEAFLFITHTLGGLGTKF